MKTYAGPKHCLSVCVTVKIWPESGHGGTGTTPSGEDQHPDRLVEALDQDSMEVSTVLARAMEGRNVRSISSSVANWILE